jgi:hypothetical protein
MGHGRAVPLLLPQHEQLLSLLLIAWLFAACLFGLTWRVLGMWAVAATVLARLAISHSVWQLVVAAVGATLGWLLHWTLGAVCCSAAFALMVVLPIPCVRRATRRPIGRQSHTLPDACGRDNTAFDPLDTRQRRFAHKRPVKTQPRH